MNQRDLVYLSGRLEGGDGPLAAALADLAVLRAKAAEARVREALRKLSE